jgi:hypothetical protein
LSPLPSQERSTAAKRGDAPECVQTMALHQLLAVQDQGIVGLLEAGVGHRLAAGAEVEDLL